MNQTLEPLTNHQSGKMNCFYVNQTKQIQIVRIANKPDWYFERVVFPEQRLLFEAPPETELEIHTSVMASAILADRIPCKRLCVS